ncbi:delta-like protein D [Mytilus trossulus]|uniref:delta-like protein D n=1 Tax=Mytilus trossulus TaxID=6551 RepID=UPI003004CE95
MPWWKTPRIVVLWILIEYSIVTKVLCTGVFELELTMFKNSKGFNINGECCNGTMNRNSQCVYSCRTFFSICFTNYQAEISSNPTCNYGTFVTAVLGGNTIDFKEELPVKFENPILFPFQFSWPGTFSLILEAWHDKTTQGPKQGSPREQIMRLAVQKSILAGSSWQQLMYDTQYTSLESSYRVVCDEHYYGTGCSNFCRPRDDQFGHYNCDGNGTKICLDGWKGPYCDQAVCLSGCHQNHGFCDAPNECKCRMGWDGPFCDKCVPYPGCLHGSCVESWQCNCEEGWGGLFCNQDLNYCTHHKPCKNQGICTNTGQGSYTCSCPKGFTGTNCEIEVDDCQNLPCDNGGQCVDVGSGYQCKCQDGFTGKRCETIAVSCSTSPCKNKATCTEEHGSYKCQCQPGYTGYNCDWEINECVSNLCQNGGRCVDELNRFRCVCPSGYNGSLCQENIDDCAAAGGNPCQNGGSCIDRENRYECRCIPGFVGPLCQINVDDCELRPCANGGTCEDKINDFSCTCVPGFSGKDCSVNDNDCSSFPCKNGATCRDLVNDFKCECAIGFSGKDCSYREGVNPTEQTTADSLENTPVVIAVNNQTNTDLVRSDAEEFTTTKLLLIVCLGAGIPLLLIIIMVMFLLLRRKNDPPPIDTSKENEENIVNNINNKLTDSNIFTTNQTSASINKISNEELQKDINVDFNTFRPGKVEKYTNTKQFIHRKDLNTQGQFSKSPPQKDSDKYRNRIDDNYSSEVSSSSKNDFSCYNTDIHIIDYSKEYSKDSRKSTLYLEPAHRHSCYSEDVLATEV